MYNRKKNKVVIILSQKDGSEKLLPWDEQGDVWGSPEKQLTTRKGIRKTYRRAEGTRDWRESLLSKGVNGEREVAVPLGNGSLVKRDGG